MYPSGKKRNLRVEIGKPTVVAQAAPEIRQWGEFQFPGIERLPDGRLHVTYTPEGYKDSAFFYGKPVSHMVSSDNGGTWISVTQKELLGHKDVYSAGLLLPNGDRILAARRPSMKVTDDIKHKLPKPLPEDPCLFREKEILSELAGYRIFRLPAGKRKWKEEYARVNNIPDSFLRRVVGGVLRFPSFGREASTLPSWIVAPDGSIIAVNCVLQENGKNLKKDYPIIFLSSTDYGYNWKILSEIPYKPDKKNDYSWQARESIRRYKGFWEPDITVLPDSSLLSLFRTTIGSLIIGPAYQSRSRDNGRTWSKPEIFDSFGVLPRLLTLGNGVTLACYGRPGFYVRASSSPHAGWNAPVEIVPPRVNRNNCNWDNADTCGYGCMTALDKETALLVYSDFEYPEPRYKTACKTILVRKIRTSVR